MTLVLSETLTAWAAGEPCDKHEIGYCATCKDQAGLRRDETGQVSFRSDCAVRTLRRLTGGSYSQAVDALKAAGFRPGRGTPRLGLRQALETAGFSVHPSPFTPEQAVHASKCGRHFFVNAVKGRAGHAWAVVDGIAEDAYRAPYRYQVYEVTG